MIEQPPKVVLLVHGYRPRRDALARFVPPGWSLKYVVDREFESRNLYTPDLLAAGESYMEFVEGKAHSHRVRAAEFVRKYGGPEYKVFAICPSKPEAFDRWRQKPHKDKAADVLWIVPPSGSENWMMYPKEGKLSPYKGWLI